MRKLHVVGFTTDLDGLIFSTRKGSKSGSFVVAISDELRDKLAEVERLRNGDESGGGPASSDWGTRREERAAERTRPQSELTPREIQARLRAGRTIDDVAKEARCPREWVERFAPPILAEQVQVIELARSLTYAKARLGDSAFPLGESVVINLADKGLVLAEDEYTAGWSAFQAHDSVWMVRFRYESRGRFQQASWEVDVALGQLRSKDRLASDLAYVDGGKRRRAGDQPDEPEEQAPIDRSVDILPARVRPGPRPPTPRARAAVSRAPAPRALGAPASPTRPARKPPAAAAAGAAKSGEPKRPAKRPARGAVRGPASKAPTAQRPARATPKGTTAKVPPAKAPTAKRSPSPAKAPAAKGGAKGATKRTAKSATKTARKSATKASSTAKKRAPVATATATKATRRATARAEGPRFGTDGTRLATRATGVRGGRPASPVGARPPAARPQPAARQGATSNNRSGGSRSRGGNGREPFSLRFADTPAPPARTSAGPPGRSPVREGVPARAMPPKRAPVDLPAPRPSPEVVKDTRNDVPPARASIFGEAPARAPGPPPSSASFALGTERSSGPDSPATPPAEDRDADWDESDFDLDVLDVPEEAADDPDAFVIRPRISAKQASELASSGDRPRLRKNPPRPSPSAFSPIRS
ncbi:MAG: septation protein SepH [Acidimicrobiales bacterium]